MNVFWFLYLSIPLCFAGNKPQSFCVQVTEDLQVQPQPEVITQPGRPGKVGPTGPAGPIGPVGPVGPRGVPLISGNCACKPSEIEQLRKELQRINGS